MAFIKITIDQQQLRNVVDSLDNLFQKPQERAAALGAIMRKAVKPALEKLRQVTPEGPTGNLKRAARAKVVTYARDGVAVGLIGYNRAGQGSVESAAGGSVLAGPDRAFHQWWLEDGTDERFVTKMIAPKKYTRGGFARGGFSRRAYRMTRNGKTFEVRGHQIGPHAVSGHDVENFSAPGYYYASSFRRLGPFKIQSPDGRIVQTDPPYPRAFFKKSKSPIRLPPIRPGGLSGRPPVTTAFRESQQQVAEILQRELRITLEEAISTISRTIQGTVST